MSGAPTGSLGGMYKSPTSAYSNISNIKLFHSDIQEGSAEQVRLALVFAGKDFEDVRLDRHEWTAEPAVNKYSYGATPVMQVDSTQGRMILTRSHAMLRYVARSFDNSCTLYPEHKPIECAAVDEYLAVFEIFDERSFGFPEVTGVLAYVEAALMNQMGVRFLCGNTVTIADLVLLCHLRDLDASNHLREFPSLCNWLSRMKEDRRVASWFWPDVSAFVDKQVSGSSKNAKIVRISYAGNDNHNRQGFGAQSYH
mmetsp:Transcript_23929/g.60399  ORF Transcript_23929/g.60399 Transcript_23929/m.60399 type:complete len:254 (-) Transcript_23929:495-1256(-)